MRRGLQSVVPARRQATISGAAAAKTAACLLVLVAVIGTVPPPARADFAPGAGTVSISDRLGQGDLVTFYFPGDARNAESQVRQAASAAGLPFRGLEVVKRSDDGLLHVRLTTTLGEGTGLFSRRVKASVLRALDLFHTGHVVLSVHPGAIVEGHTVEVDHSVFSRKVEVQTSDDVRYRVPSSWLVRVLALLLVVVGLPFVAVRRWALRLERRTVDDVEKVHKLRVGLSVAYCAFPIVTMGLAVISGVFLVPDMILSEVVPSLTRWRTTFTVAVVLVLMAILIVTDVAAYLGANPVDRRLRDTDDDTVAAARRFTRALVFGFIPLTTWLVFIAVTPHRGPFGRLAGLVVFVVVLNAGGPALVMRAQETYRLDDDLRQRLIGLCEAQGLRVRDVRAIRTRSTRTANAMITGVLPSFRYVLITDYLIDNLREDELEAIVAHEVAHGRHHHLLVKMGSWLGLIGVFEIAIALSRIAGGGALALLPVVGLVGLFFAQGRVGIALEERADDYACEQVGVDPMVRALNKLTSLNMVKRRTGAFWDAMQQHPGMERRVTRLERRSVVR